MIKFIKTEGKTDQEVQDYLNKCVSEGAEAKEAVQGANHNGFYFEDHYLSSFDYAGVSLIGETWLSNDLCDFVDAYDGKCIENIEDLLKIKDCAEKICNAVFQSGDHDEIEKQAIEIRSLLS